MKKNLILLCVLLSFLLPGSRARAEGGECGIVAGTVVWNLDSAGTLSIRGSGSMRSYATETQIPWRTLRNHVVNVEIQSGITAVGNNAFTGCRKLLTVSIPGSVQTIGNYAFSNCSALYHLTMEEGIRTIGDNAFAGCASLTAVTLPHSVIGVGQYAFARCGFLQSVEIPGSLTLLGAGTFQDCEKLKDLTLPDSLNEIGQRAFSGCKALTRLILPASLSIVRDYAIEGCTALGEIDFKGSRARWENVNYDFNRENVTRPLSQFFRQIQDQGIHVYYNWSGETGGEDPGGGLPDDPGGSAPDPGEGAAFIRSVTVEDGQVTVELSGEPDTGSRILVASYGEDGQFLGILSAPAGVSVTHMLSLPTPGAASVAAFLTGSDGRPMGGSVHQAA